MNSLVCSIIACFWLLSTSGAAYENSGLPCEQSSSAGRFARLVDVVGRQEADFTTVVSIYFQFRSKHTVAKYDVWVHKMLASVNRAPLVMFVDTVSYERLKRARTVSNTTRTTFVVYESIWSLMSELEAERNRTYAHEYRTNQYELDEESHIHTPELYATWNLKSYFVHKVASWNPYGSHYFIYTDAGAWRSRRIVHWPDARFVKRVARLTGDRMLLGQINPKNRELGKDSIQGTFFAGTCRALADFKRVFYSLHDKLMDAGAFVGKDQEIMNALAYGEDDVHRLEQSVVVLQSFRASCANKWFFYQRFFASDDQYRWMRCPQHDRLSLLELHEVYSAYPLPEDVGYASIEDFLLFAAN